MEEEPIYDFDALKKFLTDRGYTLGTRSAYEPFTPEDVKPADIANGTMTFTSKGIFVKDKNGIDRQVFLYKKDYHLERYGKPRYHILKCPTIEEFISSGGFRHHYVRANSEPVPVINIDDHFKQVEVSGLPLCGYCSRILTGYGNINSSQFVQLLRSANQNTQQNVETDLFGYTKDWDDISRQYREKHHFTCEKCGLVIQNDYDRQYMHVHHINGVKVNNEESNLMCLCLYCHAHVDEYHLKRLTTGANKIMYDDFVRRYKQRKQLDNDSSIFDIDSLFDSI